MDKDFWAKLEEENKVSEQEMIKRMKEWGETGPVLQIPEGTKIIEKGAYAARDDIARVVIPEGVVEIGDEAFIFCDQLVSVTLPSTLKRIGKSAFQECVNLSEINFPIELEEIGIAAFCNCLSLEVPNLPETVKVGDMAFHHTKTKID